MSASFKKVWNIITSVLIALIVVVAILLAGMKLFGFNVFTVLSGSMEPEIHTGSIIYVKDIDAEDIKKGDVITYMISDDAKSTHRVTEVIKDEPTQINPTGYKYMTKGDANASEDGAPVIYANVIGEVKFSIPLLGYVANYIQNPPGMYVAIAGGIVLLILIFLPEILSDDKNKEKKKKEGGEKLPPENTTATEKDAEKPSETPEDETKEEGN